MSKKTVDIICAEMNANDIKAAFLESGVALSGEEAEKLLIMCLDM